MLETQGYNMDKGENPVEGQSVTKLEMQEYDVDKRDSICSLLMSWFALGSYFVFYFNNFKQCHFFFVIYHSSVYYLKAIFYLFYSIWWSVNLTEHDLLASRLLSSDEGIQPLYERTDNSLYFGWIVPDGNKHPSKPSCLMDLFSMNTFRIH